ncbi:hypothetical protein QYE77_15045 (plasmid) [Thermanaerothrix sp. 4228-RoL]|uniref:PrgI family protein n=1 Tax=Thermanaerothrix solaris TaxID=3058434 RepID=A0ABU3NRY2_9CHLR|nr:MULTISPECIES: hypothetical protein [unclassified Thermanaerothrix]MCX7634845.1 hypothetical protein [Syntrophales bacterium]MDT8899580.1 hypothetical protein [Thermanaerothrix sp. 4228-RoL]
MFLGRDAFWLGFGAVLALIALFIPLPFFARLTVGILFLILGMAIALMRVGPDRLPPEQWLIRRLRYLRAARQYTYYKPQSSPQPPSPPPVPEPPPRTPEPSSFKPVQWAWDDIGYSSLITVALAVLGVYLVVWLYQGGAAEIASLFKP